MITEDHRKELETLFSGCQENDNLLSEWERTFVGDFTNRLAEHQEQINVSVKQQAILDRLTEKLKKAGIVL